MILLGSTVNQYMVIVNLLASIATVGTIAMQRSTDLINCNNSCLN